MWKVYAGAAIPAFVVGWFAGGILGLWALALTVPLAVLWGWFCFNHWGTRIRQREREREWDEAFAPLIASRERQRLIEIEYQEDLRRVAEVEADDTLTPDERMAAITAALMRNNGGKPHGIRNVWTGHGEPPSGFGYYDVYGRRNR